MVPRANLIFIERAFGKVRDEQFPQARGAPVGHLVTASIPTIELADDAHARGVGGPDDEMDPGHTVHRFQMRAHGLIGLIETSFGKQMEIELREQGLERVGIVAFGDGPLRIRHLDAIG